MTYINLDDTSSKDADNNKRQAGNAGRFYKPFERIIAVAQAQSDNDYDDAENNECH